jgi:hypothetical protein
MSAARALKPPMTHRIFWHYNPASHDEDVYHITHVFGTLFALHDDRYRLLDRAKFRALCGANGQFGVNAGYIADGVRGRGYFTLFEPRWCVMCLLIEGERLIKVPNDKWIG